MDKIAVQESDIPNTKPLASWSDAQKELKSTFDELETLLDIGLTPDILESPQYVKYHHRTGLNSFLSENFTCKFFYDGEEWSSAQHAYQVSAYHGFSSCKRSGKQI